MADGTKKAIEKVKKGDKVLATDPETGEQVAKTVKDTIKHWDRMSDLVLEDGTVLTTTEDHPYWSVDGQRFERTDELSSGERVLAADGRFVRVQGLEVASRRDGWAYNLSVEGIHTYHVGDDEILVHNTCPFVTPKITEGGHKHSFDRHAAQWFGGQPTKGAQMDDWEGLINQAAGSSKVVPWSSGGTLTNAHLTRVDGKYFAAQFDRETGDLVTAFVPNNGQLGAMLGLLKSP